MRFVHGAAARVWSLVKLRVRSKFAVRCCTFPIDFFGTILMCIFLDHCRHFGVGFPVGI